MGIQTFSDDKLTFLNRRHTGQQAIDAVKACQDAGFDNISIDLIYGLPGQTAGQWEDDLDVAIGMNIQHLSAYALIYEEGTRLLEMRKKRIVEEADEETSLQMFDLLIDKLLNAGFEHYEISNFARKGCRSRHNSSYWKGIPYLGCGPSAHSYDGRNRQWNTPNLELYLREVGRCASPEDFMEAAWIEKEQLSTAERYNDLVVTALRTCEGIDLSSLRHSFGGSFAVLERKHHAVKPKITEGVYHASDYPDMQELLAAADVLITDYSSSMWDFAMTDKPGFLYIPDLSRFDEKKDFYTPVRQWPYPYAVDMDGMERLIAEYDQEKAVRKKDEYLKLVDCYEKGNASEQLMRILNIEV